MMKLVSAVVPAAMAVVLGFAATGQAAEITVLRGGDTEVVDTARGGPLPTVLRGSGARDDGAKEGPTVHISIQMQGGAVAGGTYWTQDSDGRLVACDKRGTGYVGRSKIHCTAAE